MSPPQHNTNYVRNSALCITNNKVVLSVQHPNLEWFPEHVAGNICDSRLQDFSPAQYVLGMHALSARYIRCIQCCTVTSFASSCHMIYSTPLQASDKRLINIRIFVKRTLLHETQNVKFLEIMQPRELAVIHSI